MYRLTRQYGSERPLSRFNDANKRFYTTCILSMVGVVVWSVVTLLPDKMLFHSSINAYEFFVFPMVRNSVSSFSQV